MSRRIAGQLAWSVTERLLRRDTMCRFQILQRSDFFSAEQLRQLQKDKLRKLLRIARRHCRFYRERIGGADDDVNDDHITIETLRTLPTITRGDITDHLADMTWFNAPNGGAIPHTTGGSSGEPLKFHIDRARQAADWAARWRARGWWGVRPGDPEIIVWGAPAREGMVEKLRRMRDAMLNQYLLSAFDMTDETMNAYLDRIQHFQPACIYGYASSVALLARHAIQQGRDVRSDRLKAVFVTGEVLIDSDRDDITEAFGVPVVIEYGCRDGGLLAVGCTGGELHVPQENVIVELLDLDGRPVEPGETGEVTVTYLEMFAMPLIRYRTGDLARQPADRSTRSSCVCGRCGDTLTEVRGRVTDQIITRNGSGFRRMHALSLIYVLREVDGLRQFRVTQPSLDKLEVDLVGDERLTPQTEAAIAQGLRDRMGCNVTIDIHRRDRIPPIASGKHACVVSHVQL